MSHVMDRREPAAQPTGFVLAALLDVFVLHRKMMFWIFGSIALLGVSWAFLSSPVYQADILVQIDEPVSDASGRSPLGDVATMFDVKSSADSEMRVLASRSVMANAVDLLHLDIEARPVRFPLIGNAISRANRSLSTPGLFGIGGYTWGSERIAVSSFDVPVDLEGASFDLTVTDAGHFRLSGPGLDGDQAGVIGAPTTFQSASGPLTLNVQSIAAKPGARFRLTRHSRVDTVNELQRDITVSRKGKDEIDVIEASLRGPDPQRIAETLNAVALFYVKQNIDRKTEEANSSRAFLEAQLGPLKDKLDAAEAALFDLRSRLSSVDISGEAQVLLQQSAANETLITQARQQRAGLMAQFGPTFPTVVAMDEKIAILRAQSDSLKTRIDLLPQQQREIVRAERDVKVNKDLYMGTLNNIGQLNMLQASPIGNVRLIDSALVSHQPVPKRRQVIIAAALIVGALAAVAAAYLRDMLFSGVSDVREIEQAVGLPVFAAVPLASRSRSVRMLPPLRHSRARGLLALTDPGDPAIESIRSLRAALQHSMLSTGNNVVMFTSPSPLIGKSFVSSNFAAVLAAAGKRVLLIDGDLRRGKLSEMFANDSSNGFADVVAQAIPIKAAIIQTGVPNLDFLPAGSRPRIVGDLLASRRLDHVMRELSAGYDVVVLDTAPLLAVPDAAILAPFAAGNVFVLARAGFTKLGALDETVRRLQQVGVEVAGVILNGIDPHAGHFRYGTSQDWYRYPATESRKEMDAS
ncbi:tyrosine-protein kinase Etk/Wzc [Paraburkholderia fungorum]|uniref:Tyrosine-protein kinase Etk/Wzc n=1 Tax=Paraburkholderia fungorum TaxID=134537 RepID=A0A1H1HFQ1_9BURK|nr:polysaccharide biosynthesis tyrosine autokinase [Paraburkholderia fungorum]SDR24199.1 tyrosine-protein kinase Etk/Wzc [Paraburkholderia fungorum]